MLVDKTLGRFPLSRPKRVHRNVLHTEVTVLELNSSEKGGFVTCLVAPTHLGAMPRPKQATKNVQGMTLHDMMDGQTPTRAISPQLICESGWTMGYIFGGIHKI